MTEEGKEDILQERIIGNKAAIRSFLIGDPEEINRFQAIDEASDDSSMEGESASIEDNVNFMMDANERKVICVAVSGSGVHVDKNEVGKLQGYVFAYKVDNEFNSWINRHKFGDNQKQSPYRSFFPIEISYAKDKNIKSHQISSGVRAILLDIARWNAQIDAARETTISKNGKSSRVLIRHENRTHDDKPRIPVFVRVSPGDVTSIRVAEAAGFESVNIRYEDDDVYLLNWDKWNSIIQKNMQEELPETPFPSFQHIKQ